MTFTTEIETIVPQTVTSSTPVVLVAKPLDRKYQIVTAPTKWPKGQAAAVLSVLLKNEKIPMTPAQVAEQVDGYKTKFETIQSVSYHLHQMFRKGIVRVVS